MKERSGSQRRRSSKDEEKVRSRSSREKERPKGKVRGESVARQRKTDEEEAKRLSALVKEESMRETSRRRRSREEVTKRGSELSVSGSRREERIPTTVPRRQATVQERRRNFESADRRANDLVRAVRDMSSQPSSVASVPMPKSLPSLASLGGQTKKSSWAIGNEPQPMSSFEESQGSNKRDVDNPFHRSYSRVRENPVHEQREQNSSLTSLKREEPRSSRRDPGLSLISVKRERRLSLGSLTSEEPTGVVRVPPGVEQVGFCNLRSTLKILLKILISVAVVLWWWKPEPQQRDSEHGHCGHLPGRRGARVEVAGKNRTYLSWAPHHGVGRGG